MNLTIKEIKPYSTTLIKIRIITILIDDTGTVHTGNMTQMGGTNLITDAFLF